MSKKTSSSSSVAGDGDERCRLRNLAVSNGLLIRGEAARVKSPLPPAQSTVKLQGRDIVRKGAQRKSRFLLSFPGLVGLKGAAGGRVGELAGVGSRNPVLYLEFPQGRIKLFGTHIYPKNKYLTLQLTRSAKGIICEDAFESLIVFSEAWWIGTQKENPNEVRLDFPENITNCEDSSVCDFKGGAGAVAQDSHNTQSGREDSPEDLINTAVNITNNDTESTPVRQSARMAGKTRKYTELSSGEDSVASDDDDLKPISTIRRVRNPDASTGSVLENMDILGSSAVKKLDASCDNENNNSVTATVEASESENLETKNTHKEPLVQTSVSSLFKKVADRKKTASTSVLPKVKESPSKRRKSNVKETTQKSPASKGKSKELAGKGARAKGQSSQRKKKPQVSDDEIEDISDSSDQDDSDADWAM